MAGNHFSFFPHYNPQKIKNRKESRQHKLFYSELINGSNRMIKRAVQPNQKICLFSSGPNKLVGTRVCPPLPLPSIGLIRLALSCCTSSYPSTHPQLPCMLFAGSPIPKYKLNPLATLLHLLLPYHTPPTTARAHIC